MEADDLRSFLIQRLQEDIIGPSAPDEELMDRPSDRYLTGILYPRRLEFGADEDEKLGHGTGGDGSEDDSSEDVPPAALHKPSSAGLSFSVAAGPQEIIRLEIRIRGGTYTRIEKARPGTSTADGSSSSVSEKNGPGSDPREGAAADERPQPEAARASKKLLIAWRRNDHDLHVSLSLSQGGKPDYPLDSHGLPGFSLYVTQASASGGRMITVRLVNEQECKPGTEGKRPDEMSLFQSTLEVRTGAPFRFIPRPAEQASDDQDSLTAALLYRRLQDYAVGHTCSAAWAHPAGDTVEWIATTWLPEQTVRMVSANGAPPLKDAVAETAVSTGLDPLAARDLADADRHLEALLQAVPAGYAAWLVEQEALAKSLTGKLAVQAETHLSACRDVLRRIRRGVECIRDDADIRGAFRLMNQSMQVQRIWTERVRAKREKRELTGESHGLRWYPFQLAFILQNVESIADASSSERAVMDLLWFPTGGGKTEAYLGLIAFTAFLRRIRRVKESDRGAGVSCIMRYTLRLLTLQQFQRAATLMLACEYVRRGYEVPSGAPDLMKAAPFSVGLWVGGEATPNDLAKALIALKTPHAPTSPKQLTSCPCCGDRLSWESNADDTDIIVSCRSKECALAKAVPALPVSTVDELIYREPPTLLFATVDKFAQIVRKSDTRALFNTGTAAPPPDLIIQDELHLISGPLGTLTAIYECAIDRICSRDGRMPKVIGSTATIRRADEQIRALFNRRAAQFPPPGLDIDDSCFAFVEPDATTRRYAGVTTAGRSAKFTLQAVYASLLQAAPAISDAKRRDGYHTLVGYFNALRELGGALVLSQDDVPASMELIAKRRGEAQREPREIVELTSRVSQQQIRTILDDLELQCDVDGAVDVLLATNMISVGVDVSRLALMVVMGQPKGISEYIQATSRVGRDRSAPGLVVTVLNANKARDRAHFESFTGVHQALYRGVEATSVTPFAARARDRALHAAVVAVARHLVEPLSDSAALTETAVTKVEALILDLARRAADIDAEEAQATKDDLAHVLRLWKQRSSIVNTYWNDEKEDTSLLMAAERAVARNRTGLSAAKAWPTLNSMRTVEAGTPFKLVERLKDGEAIQGTESQVQ